MIILGSVTYINEFGNQYSATADLSGLAKTNETLNAQRELMNETYEDIVKLIVDASEGNVFLLPYDMIKAAWGATKTIFGSWSVVAAILGDINRELANLGIILPDWLVPSLVSLILMTVIAIAIYAFFKWKFED